MYKEIMENFSCVLKDGKETFVKFVSEKEMAEYLFSFPSSLIVADENASYAVPGERMNVLVLKSGEEMKNQESLFTIIRKALSISLSRSSTFISVGGGVVSDMTAFAASVYMRGAGLVLLPSTLLSMVDASLGGKSAIDFDNVKNLIGTFYPAEEVVIAPHLLKTLDDHQFFSGLGEVIKHAFLTSDKTLFDFLVSEKERILSRDENTLGEMVYLSLLVKKDFIERDPEEKKGIRSALNLGHTFAHALESITNYKIPHGHAVSWGLSRAAELGVMMGITDKNLKDDIDFLLSLYGYDTSLRIRKEEIPLFLSYKEKDKKRGKNGVNFVLMRTYGDYVLTVPDESLLIKVIQE